MKTATRDVLAAVDDVLAEHEALELDLIMDQVFPPGEHRNVKALRGRWGEESRDRGYNYPDMVRFYSNGSDPEGEGNWTTDEVDDLSDKIEPRWRLGKIGRAPRNVGICEHEWHRLPPGQMWVGRFSAYAPRIRLIDHEWLAAEAKWLEAHSEP